MSKSLGNAIGITESPREIFGKTMSIPDAEIVNYYALVADASPAEVDAAKGELAGGGNPRDVKARLAARIVSLYHGAEAGDAARKEFDRIFREGAEPDAIETVRVVVPGGRILIAHLLQQAGLAPSSTRAMRLVQEGAVHLDNTRVTDEKMSLDAAAEPGREIVIRVGRKQWKRVILVS
jgi:tyrosyl-tRNA synthetase